jgi:D-alanyl-lipoteichoic acid acyltransferase DltB (MBOAT superfamily)
MTLTGWLRDYVFMPLRAVTRDWSEIGLAFSLTVNMVLIGLWHGVTLGFLLYGLFQSVFLVAEALSSSRRNEFYRANPKADKAATWTGPIYVYTVVAIGSVFFHAPSLAAIGNLFHGLFSGLSGCGAELRALFQPPNHRAWVAFPAYLLILMADKYRRKHGFRIPSLAPALRWPVYSGVTAMWILIALALLASEKGADPFVYALF